MEKTATKYVIQRADGQFYYRKGVSSAWGFTDDFAKASLFESERGAKSRLDIAGDGAIIREVMIGLPELEPVHFPSVWHMEGVKKCPSRSCWAILDDDGNYSYGMKFFDEDMNEITKEEYEKLTKKPED